MVAEMASCGAACQLEDGDGDIPGPDSKDNLTESDSSSSENAETSTEESSEDEEEADEGLAGGGAEKEGGEEDNEASKESKNEPTPDPEAGVPNGKEHHFESCCEKCKSIQRSHGAEVVTPRRMTKGRFQVQLEGEGTYECSVTGLVFEASERVLVRYSILSWSKFSSFLRDSWKFAGPIFNVDTVDKEPSVLKSIQFPHSVCLADPENEMKFSVLHIKDNRPLIEPTVDHSGSHVKWRVSSLSPVGPIMQSSQPVEHHGVVLVYKRLCGDSSGSYSFHVYLSTNSASDIKDVNKQVRSCKSRYMKIDKPPTCHLDEGTYRLLSEPEGEIKPQDLKFTLAVTKMKGYFEAFFEHPPPFQLSLIETASEQTVWSATIRECKEVSVSGPSLSRCWFVTPLLPPLPKLSGDCVENKEKKPTKRTHSGQRSSSPAEEEISLKRPRWQEESEEARPAAAAASGGGDLSEKQLLQVAKRLGKEWKQVAIFLDLNSRELDDIQAAEKDVTMQKLKMLVEWKSRRRAGQATAAHLHSSLEELDDLPSQVHQLLKDMAKNEAAK